MHFVNASFLIHHFPDLTYGKKAQFSGHNYYNNGLSFSIFFYTVEDISSGQVFFERFVSESPLKDHLGKNEKALVVCSPCCYVHMINIMREIKVLGCIWQGGFQS